MHASRARTATYFLTHKLNTLERRVNYFLYSQHVTVQVLFSGQDTFPAFKLDFNLIDMISMAKKAHSNGDSPHRKGIEINSVPFPSKSENDLVSPCDPEDNTVAIAYVDFSLCFFPS
jgi:hypothetical protein